MTATIFGLVTGIVIARVLGPEKRGYFGLVIMACTLLFTLGHFGTGSAIAYFTGKKLYDRKSILKFLLFSSLVLGSTISIIFFFLYRYIGDIWSDIPRSIMLAGLVSVPFFFLYNFLDRFLLSILRVKRSIIMHVFSSFLYLVLILVFVLWMKGGIQNAIACYTASFIITSIVAFIVFTREYRPMGRLDLSMSGPLLSFGIRVYLIVIFNFLNYRLGIILVKHYLTVSDVSYFQIATGIAERFWYFPNAMSSLLFPTLLTMGEKSAGFTAKVCRNNLFFMVILAAASIFVARPVILLLYGAEYEMVAYAFLALLFGIVIFPFYKFMSSFFAAEKKLEIGIFASAVGIAVNVAANILLIPRFGVIGAGIASSISYSALSIILLLFFRSYTKIPFADVLVPKREDFSMYREGIRKILSRLRRRPPKGAPPGAE